MSRLDEKLANNLAQAVLTKYQSLPAKLQVQHTEWTVLAGIVAHRVNSNEIVVIAIATGTKCLGERPNEPNGFVVRDSHAEVLCRRALLRVMYHDIKRLETGSDGVILERTMSEDVSLGQQNIDSERESETPNQLPSLEREERSVRFRLRRDTHLHLIISDSPCGCASEFPRLGAQLSKGDQGASIRDEAKMTNLRPTSDEGKQESKRHQTTKDITDDQQSVEENKQTACHGGSEPAFQSRQLVDQKSKACNTDFRSAGSFEEGPIVGARVTGAKPTLANGKRLMTKPGRSDLPPEKRSTCMSCSDKLLKWHCLGLEGALLRWLGVDYIGLTGIVLMNDAATTCLNEDGDSSELLATQAREIVLGALESSLGRADEFLATVSDRVKIHFQVAQNVSFPQSRIRIDPPTKGKDKMKSAGKVSWWNCTGECESLIGVRGVRDGASKSADPAKVASALAKASLYILCNQICNETPKQTYLSRKQSPGKYLRLRAEFFRCFAGYFDHLALSNFSGDSL